MRVVLLTPYGPGRQHGHAASDTVVHLIPRLARHVELFVYAPDGRTHVDERTPDGYTLAAARAHVRPRATDRFGVVPAWLRADWSRAATREAAALVRRLRPDVVHAEYLQTAEAVFRFPRSVLTLHDVTEAVMRESYRAAPPGERPYRLAELLRTRRFERAATAAAGAVVTLAEPDRELAARRNPRTVVVRPGVRRPTTAWSPPGTGPVRFVFTGAMWRRANVLAARFLAAEVMPLVWRDLPDARLRLVGARPGPDVQRLATSDDRVEVTGTVPDLGPELRAAHVVLAPSVLGGGVLMKVVNAMAAGCPVVTTPAAAASVGASELAVFVAATANTFATAAVRAARDPDEARRRGAAARLHIGLNFTWDAAVRGYLDAYALAATR
jgi:glycosyltransferase involved in cell wall biosynthesis